MSPAGGGLPTLAQAEVQEQHPWQSKNERQRYRFGMRSPSGKAQSSMSMMADPFRREVRKVRPDDGGRETSVGRFRQWKSKPNYEFQCFMQFCLDAEEVGDSFQLQ
jgi:hypothetical protein